MDRRDPIQNLKLFFFLTHFAENFIYYEVQHNSNYT